MYNRLELDKEKETLLIPLYSKAKESIKPNPIIYDKKALEIIDLIEYDSSQLNIPSKTEITLCMRAKQFDNYTKVYLKNNPKSTVVHLGCGLDSRFNRVDNGTVEWYDLDFPEVIELRKSFYKESHRYHMIPSSVTDFTWIDYVNPKEGPFLFLAEGLLMYLKEDEVKDLFHLIRDFFPKCYFIFDAFNKLTVRGINRHPSIRKTKASINWGINDSKKLEEWDRGIKLIDEWYFTDSMEISKLSLGYKAIFRLMDFLPIAKKSHRIIVVSIEL